jgi:hypothetical protein
LLLAEAHNELLRDMCAASGAHHEA